MTPAERTTEARGRVRLAFWAGVFILWLPLACLAIVVVAWAAATAGLWQVPPLADRSDPAAVTRAWGRPTEVVRDREAIASYLRQYRECAVTRVAEVWVYDRFVLQDSVVFVSGEGHAVCVTGARGMSFSIRSH